MVNGDAQASLRSRVGLIQGFRILISMGEASDSALRRLRIYSMEIVRDWVRRSGTDGVKFKVNTATRLWQRAFGETKSGLSEITKLAYIARDNACIDITFHISIQVQSSNKYGNPDSRRPLELRHSPIQPLSAAV